MSKTSKKGMLKLDPEVQRRLKIAAAKQGITKEELGNELLRAKMKELGVWDD